jgi:DNA repair exonuclease SbcCD ATPase subunit
MIKIDVDFNKLEHVVHLADIHIRLYNRLGEYQRVFDTLYDDIEKLELDNFIIVVAGDILHSKIDLSPECLEVTSNFFRRLSSIAPTLIIDGNHDLNLSNNNRMRSLHPIINNIESDDLHYLSASDVYEVADVQFAHFGISDDKELWPRVEEITSDVKVCLHHGSVHGAATDIGYVINAKEMEHNAFDGFDIVMLGDIHKYQIMQDRNVSESKPIIAYPGSLLQQNHGENLENHGFILWDMQDCSMKFHHVANDTGYCTVVLEDGVMDLPVGGPKNLRLRLLHDEADNSAVQKALALIKKQFNVIDSSISRISTSLEYSNGVSPGLEIGNLEELNLQNKLIMEWLDQHYPNLSDALLESISSINMKMNDKVDFNDQSRNIHWRPLEFKFSNLFSYGEDNYINFTNFNGTLGIFAPNASGKSSSMEALIFTLFDKTPRAFKGDHIMNNRKKNFKCELKFEVNGEIYGIRREGTRNKAGAVRVDVEFWKQDEEGKIVSLNGEDRFTTNFNIRDIVGTYEDFILTTLSGQNGNALFIDKSHTERKNLLNQFMGLDVFEKLEKAASEESKELKGVLKKFGRDDFTDKLVGLQQNAEETTDKLSDNQSQLDELDEEVTLIQTDIETLSSQKIKVPEKLGDPDKLSSELTIISNKQDALGKNIDIIDGERNLSKEKINNIKNRVGEYDAILLKKNFDLHKKYENALTKVQAQFQSNNTVTAATTIAINNLLEFDYNMDCDVCVENNKSKIEQLDELRQTTEKLTQESLYLSSEIESHTELVYSLVTSVDRYNAYLSLRDKLSEEEDNHSTLLESYTKYTKQLDALIAQEVILVSDIESIAEYEESISKNKHLDGRIQELRYDLATKKNSISELSGQKLELHATLRVLENSKATIMDDLAEMSTVELEFEAHKYYIKAINRDGVPYDIISNVIPALEAEINSILSQIASFTVALDIDGKNFGGRIVYDSERTWPLENSSGMERFISGLAIRVALLRASNLPKSNFLIIDEGMGSLDNEYLYGMQLFFQMLKSQFDFIIVISHLDSVRDMVESVIEITKENGYSKINTK